MLRFGASGQLAVGSIIIIAPNMVRCRICSAGGDSMLAQVNADSVAVWTHATREAASAATARDSENFMVIRQRK